ncbi:MAG TPA: hypothetical protein VF046_07280 [Gemmatimonadales bacterium]
MTGLPGDVRRFIDRYIDSPAQLEVLLLARRSPGRNWSAEDMARELYDERDAIGQCFESLLGRGLLRESPAGFFQYAPRSARLDLAVGRLAEVYRAQRAAVLSILGGERG